MYFQRVWLLTCHFQNISFSLRVDVDITLFQKKLKYKKNLDKGSRVEK